MGIVRPRAGSIVFDGEPLHGLPPYRIARAGLGLVPEGRQIFPRLNVLENLTVAFRAPAGSPAWDADKVFVLFPRLAERRANMGNQLSGGEQQMLAIGRALMTNPRLLMLDEATEGLAPLIRAEIWRVIRQLKEMGQSILIVDKHVNVLARIADRHYILEKGRVAWTGSSAELVESMETQRRLLGV
jgi:branched-chain amino acid transport system ATP-binding protein